ncbi:Endonuclease/exonuclease/phosphatase [Mycena filopes]|nr:Endonuclease/exonuclease/phosphatase [Mycena filopes]
MFPSDSSDRVIPNPMHQLRMYRWRGSRNRWHRMSPDRDHGEPDIPPSTIEFVSWNVSFDAPMVAQRMETTLRYLEEVVFKCRGGEAPEPCVVLLQEVHAVQGLQTILANPWVREHFFVTPADTSKWPEQALYGNVTLVEKSIPVKDASILEFGVSEMQRTGVIVDIKLGAPKRDYDVVLRIINTHLESLETGEARPSGPAQVADQGPGVRGGIISGDMNHLSDKDKAVPKELGLEDAWKKGDKDERGFTWGEQPPTRYPANRLDKILYLGRKGYRVDEPRRIGVGLKLTNERLPNGLWTSDHYGLWTKVHVLR